MQSIFNLSNYRLIFTTLGWYIYYSSINRKVKNLNIGENIISATHAIICIILSYLYYTNEITNLEYLMNLSIGYYLIDSFINIIHYNNKMNIIYLLHHFVSILIVSYLSDNNTSNVYMTLTGFLLAELSNIPLYIVYFLFQLKKSYKSFYLTIITYLFIIIETICYISLRLLIGSYVLYNMYTHIDITLSILGLLIEIMSLFWSYKLCYQVLNYKFV